LDYLWSRRCANAFRFDAVRHPSASGGLGSIDRRNSGLPWRLGCNDRWTTEIAVTNQRVILKRGLIRRDTIEINMPKVESVDIRQSIFGRLLGYGTVIVRGTGGSFNPLTYVSQPLPLRRAVTLPVQKAS
jgi:Bacterial PH domain